MVLGLRTKTPKSPSSVQLDYIIHILEVKPWPPSQSLRTLRAVLIQWEHGHRTSGFTNQAEPSLGLGSIEFNESFRLRLTLVREASVKGTTYHKNCIQFNLYEPRRDNALKGQLLGSAVLDLAAYGVIKESLSVTTPINCKRTYSNSALPLLFLKIQPRDRNHIGEYADEGDDDAADLSGCSSALNKKIETAGSAKIDLPDEEQANESHPNSAGNIAWISKGSASYRMQSSALKETDKQHSCSHLDEKNSESRENHEECVDMQKLVRFENGLVSSIERSFRKSSGATEASRKEPRNLVSDLENRIKLLEGELREAAALEVSLYSVVAEHGSSVNKVHAPARRLSRLYFHANKKSSKSGSGRASASKSVVSGLLLVAKACGNDVPRLTFWLSNSIVLRAIISKSLCLGDKNGKKKSSPSQVASVGAALEKVESWIFSRIVESLWWQTFTPHMQSAMNKSQQQEQGNFSVQLWEKAFRDACERICPVRGGGHDCGCLTLLSRLIMEQLVARLDVAMFNAILRESADQTPTDPVADPISDASVLPIRAGKASFGGGVQLKNAIGNWSRWLSDLFDMDDDDLTSRKPFPLLNALSDLMMLPKDMLLSPSIRKEVCPAFGLPLLTSILVSFVPDEFCPDPIPRAVVEALNTGTPDPLDSEDCSIVHVPCEAAPIVYHSPSVDSVATLTHSNSKLSLLKKSQTSDDELDQLNSPLKAIIRSSNRTPTPTSPITVRYQLLQEVWKE